MDYTRRLELGCRALHDPHRYVLELGKRYYSVWLPFQCRTEGEIRFLKRMQDAGCFVLDKHMKNSRVMRLFNV